jgi:Ser/Thr protein kinase RdoA (MazF antagonist)
MKEETEDPVQKLRSLYDGHPVELEPMAGSTSADLYLVRAGTYRHVLRVFKQERWTTPAQELSSRESTILEALRATDLPTPEPVATLPGNGVVMSWLPGQVDLPARPERSWMKELARSLCTIHQTDIQVPFEYESWNDTRNQPAPDWWPDAVLWQTAQAATARSPDYEPRFVHRDYHPVNVLWEQGRICGVVDWINACMGPQGIDVAHCRLNLAIMYGIEAADAFLDAYASGRPGYVHDPFWDLDDALGALPNVEPYPPWAIFGLTGLTTEIVRARLLDFIRAALNTRPGR